MINNHIWPDYTEQNKMHVVSIGGGLSSTIELPQIVIDKYGSSNVHLVIAALAGEHDDLWRLVDEAERRFNKPVTRVSYRPAAKGLPKYLVDAPEAMWLEPWEIFNQVNLIGNTRRDPCSKLLKRDTLRRYILDYYPPQFTVLHVGITTDEIDRTIAVRGHWQRLGYAVEFDLASEDKLEQARVKALTSLDKAQRAYDLLGWTPELYAQNATGHNNCGGFCVKAGKAAMARLLMSNPDLYYYHAERERLWNDQRGTFYTVMRDQYTDKDGLRRSKPLTMYDFADRILAQPEQISLFDDGNMTGCVSCSAVA